MNNNGKITIIKILFGIYLLLLVWIILFKTSFSISDLINLSKIRSINLIPFYYPTEVNFHLREVIANIIIFIPLGIYLKMLNINNKNTILYGFIFSILLEISQFVFRLGASDITDIITNTTGVILGVLVYILLEKIIKNKEKSDNILKIIALFVTILFSLLMMLLIISN